MSRANEPAFPLPLQTRPDGTVESWPQYGIKLREHFAGLAMQGLLANGVDGGLRVSELAVAHAEHLLAELAKVPS